MTAHLLKHSFSQSYQFTNSIIREGGISVELRCYYHDACFDLYIHSSRNIAAFAKLFGTSHTHFPYTKRFLTQRKLVYLQKTDQIKPVPLSQIPIQLGLILIQIILSHPTFHKTFVGQLFKFWKRVMKLVDSLLALVPTMAEPPKITHLQRCSSSTRH